MKTVLLLLGLAFGTLALQAQPVRGKAAAGSNYNVGIFPKPSGFINDFVGLFTPAETARLDSLVAAFESETSVEIAVVTLPANYVEEKNFESYTLALFRRWGVGKAATNNGVLLCIAPTLRKVRIQNGYGIEKVMSDQQTKQVLDSSILPRFKEGRYFDGTYQGIQAIIRHLRQNRG